MLYNLVEDEDLYVGDVGCVVGNEVVPSSLCGIIVPRFKHELMYRLDCNYDSFSRFPVEMIYQQLQGKASIAKAKTPSLFVRRLEEDDIKLVAGKRIKLLGMNKVDRERAEKTEGIQRGYNMAVAMLRGDV